MLLMGEHLVSWYLCVQDGRLERKGLGGSVVVFIYKWKMKEDTRRSKPIGARLPTPPYLSLLGLAHLHTSQPSCSPLWPINGKENPSGHLKEKPITEPGEDCVPGREAACRPTGAPDQPGL